MPVWRVSASPDLFGIIFFPRKLVILQASPPVTSRVASPAEVGERAPCKKRFNSLLIHRATANRNHETVTFLSPTARVPFSMQITGLLQMVQ